jgi:hypothetical protein
LRKRRGFILFTIILLALLITAIIVGLTILGQHSALLAGRQLAGEQAYYAAEAGIAAGLVELKREGELPTNPWTRKMEGSDDEFTVELIGNSGTTDLKIPGGPTLAPGTTYLMSVGESRGRRRQVGATIAPEGGRGPVGVLARNYLFQGGAVLDAYDSNLGDYGPATAVDNTDLLATNESSGLSYFTADPVDVQGKIFVGPGGDPDSQIGPLISHDGAESLSAPIEIPEVSPPTGLTRYEDRVVLFGARTLPPGEYNLVTVGGMGKIQLQSGGKYVIRTLNMVPGGKLELSGDDVEVYVTDRLWNVQPGSIINTTRRASNLKLFHTKKNGGFWDCWLTGGSQAYLSFVAPDIDVQLGVGAEIYGSVMTTRAISVFIGSKLHYDVALRDTTPQGEFAVISRHRL